MTEVARAKTTPIAPESDTPDLLAEFRALETSVQSAAIDEVRRGIKAVARRCEDRCRETKFDVARHELGRIAWYLVELDRIVPNKANPENLSAWFSTWQERITTAENAYLKKQNELHVSQAKEREHTQFMDRRRQVAFASADRGARLLPFNFNDDLHPELVRGIDFGRFLSENDLKHRFDEFRFLYADYSELKNLRAPLIGIWPASAGHLRKPALVVDRTEAHLMTMLGSRQGKSACHVIPNVLAYQGSCVVMDTKGEIYEETADHLRAKGRKVLRFSPFEMMSEETFNPLDFIFFGPAETAAERARIIVAAMLPQQSARGDSRYWDSQTKMLTLALLVYVSRSPEADTRTMATLSQLAVHPEGLIKVAKDVVTNLSISDTSDEHITMSRYLRLCAEWEKGGQIIDSSVASALDEWRSYTVKQHTAQSSFNLTDLIIADSNGQPFTLFIDLPSNRAKDYEPVMRTLLTVVFEYLKATPRTRGQLPILMLLDEFVNYGRVDVFTTALREAASYGVRLWPFVQEFSKLKALYPEDWMSFLANATVIGGATQDHEWAQQQSETLGQFTERLYYTETEFEDQPTGEVLAAPFWNHRARTDPFGNPVGGSDVIYTPEMAKVPVARERSHFHTEAMVSVGTIKSLPKAWQYVQPVGTPPLICGKLAHFDPYFLEPQPAATQQTDLSFDSGLPDRFNLDIQ